MVCSSGIESQLEAEITGGWPPFTVEVNGIASIQNIKWIAFGSNAPSINTLVVTDALGNVAELFFSDPDIGNSGLIINTTSPLVMAIVMEAWP
ncbi:MAG: hypothetical protein SH856_12980 [Flavobacteriales bacterium]|nr:hypothetical protein [Flavobacteriales bacterium]